MRWIITQDLIDNGAAVGFGHSDQGGWCRDLGGLSEPLPTEIRLKDDDGEIYYIGRTRDIGEAEGRAFAPLDWAMTNAGATTLEFRPAGSTAAWSAL